MEDIDNHDRPTPGGGWLSVHAALRCEERLGRIEEKLDRLLAEK